MSKLCKICLETNEKLININENYENNIKIIIKLNKCVPEVEWKIDYNICENCLNKLELVYAFRELCIQSYLIDKNKENYLKLESNDELLETETLSEKPLELNENQIESCFICFHCDKKYKSKILLANHIKNEHESNCLRNNRKTRVVTTTTKSNRRRKPWICTNCGRNYTTETALTKHTNICLNNDDNDNKKIDEIKLNSKTEKENETTTQQNIKTELLNLTDNKNKNENSCDKCGTYFTNKYLLKRHIRNVHATEKKFKCELCERKFASPVYLNAHKRYHIGERKHICSFCGKGYITASDLYHHEKIHANKRAYRCEQCPKAFNTSSDLHKHKICVHMDRELWKYECNYCKRKFPLKTNLDTHTKTHTGERNFLCHLCDRKCINRSVLKRHIESHSNVKSFKCNLCNLGYKYKKSLDLHLMKIHGLGNLKLPTERIKKYFCNLCPKSYFANNKLQKHLRSHTGERPFHCNFCDKSFTDKSYIKQHCKLAHASVINFNNSTIVSTTY